MSDSKIAVPIIFLAIVLTAGALKVGVGAETVPTIWAFGVPLVVGVWLTLRASTLPSASRHLAWLSVWVVTLGCELSLFSALVPQAPLAGAELSQSKPDCQLALPDGTERAVVELTALSRKGNTNLEGKVALDLERGSRHEKLVAEFHRQKLSARASKRRSFTGKAVQDDQRFHVNLAGSGPLVAHLRPLSGNMGRHVALTVLRDPLWSRALPYVLGSGAVAAIVLTALELVEISAFAPAVSAISVFGGYLPDHLSRGDRYSSVLGALIVASVVGAVGALLLKALLGRLLPSRLKA